MKLGKLEISEESKKEILEELVNPDMSINEENLAKLLKSAMENKDFLKKENKVIHLEPEKRFSGFFLFANIIHKEFL